MSRRIPLALVALVCLGSACKGQSRGSADVREAQPTAADAAVATSSSADGYCESTWPSATDPTSQQTHRCIDHWLAYAYGKDFADEDLDLDPIAGGAENRRFTAAQFERMAAHVRAACQSSCTSDGETLSREERALEYFEASARLKLDLFDGNRMASFEKTLGKVLAGKPLARAEVEGYTDVTLWRLRNAAFARHGREFTNPDLQRFFYGDRGEASRTTLLPLKTNASYSDALLTDVDRANVDLIQKVEST